MPIDGEQKDGFLLNIWQAITLVGDVRGRSDEIDPSELETVLTDAESLLIGAVSEAAQRPGGPTRHRRGLRFWKAMRDTPSDHVSWRGATSVIPFPGSMISGASPCLSSNESAAPKTSTARFPRLNPERTETARPFQSRSVSIGRTARLLLLVLLAVLPMIALQAWHERELRNERGDVIRERVVYRVHQLAAEIGEWREGARQLLLAIAQLEAVKLRQPEACSALLAKLRSSYPNYSLLAAADAEGRIFCASGQTVASVADQSFFRRAIVHDGLVVGNYRVDPTNGQKMINFAQQFAGSNGGLAGVIFAGLDLIWLSDHLKGNGLPPTSSKLIADREGNIIDPAAHPEEFVGKNMRASHERIMDGGEAGWEEVTGVDGVTRIFGYVPSSLPPKDFFLSIGEAKAESFAAINGATWRGTALIVIGVLGSICIAWAGRNLVLGTARGLRQATANHRRLIRAELRARVFFWPQLVRYRRLHRASVGSLLNATAFISETAGSKCAMPYCITLRSRTGARITGWYDGSDSRWSTDNKRQKLFAKKSDARPVCDELRILCPRNTKVINIEAVQHDPSLDLVLR